MERTTSRILYLVGLVIGIIAFVAFMVIAITDPAAGKSADQESVATILEVTLATLVLVAGLIIALIGWIGALVKTARLAQWQWFALLLIPVTSGIAMLVYIFAGPTQPKAVTG